MKTVVLAGMGLLPVEAAKNLKARGDEVHVITFVEQTQADFTGIADTVVTYSLGQVGKIIKHMKSVKADATIFVGKIDKSILERNLKLDLRALWILARLKDRQEDTIMQAIVDEVEGHGIKVLSQLEVLSTLVVKEGVYSKRKPNRKQRADIKFGYEKARGVAALDIGQVAIVKNKTIFAIESIEGTNATIKRGAEICRGGFTFIKVAKPIAEYRFDLPVIGMETLTAFAQSGGAVFAMEADLTLVVNLQECIEFANEHDFVLMAYKN
ncbi:MAG: UDP-2,3-diacylglucosamine diphosphatase LpxI [Deferribacteraceae bacterium]|jgi:DUF1009 family protein|nr:UDP-2,3-diacylglucosamine diphosphatase LpxI [Deferribacteraceae bacterium]